MPYMGHDLIIAPHIDDEIIGCYTYIDDVCDTSIDILYVYDITEERKKSLDLLKQKYNHIENTFILDQDIKFKLHEKYFIDSLLDYDRILFPDPIYETHPDHKEIGNIGQYIFKNFDNGQEIIFYSVNMNAPYIRKLHETTQKKKRDLLNELYPDQSSLWENDYKYFLFEGTCKWLRNPRD